MFRFDATGQPYRSAESQVLLRPRTAMAAYSGAFTSYANMSDQWIDLNSTSVQYYGFKLLLPPASVSSLSSPAIDLMFDYTIVFRNVR